MNKTRHRRFGAAWTILALLLGTQGASAQAESEAVCIAPEAERKAFADAAMKAGEYAVALACYQALYHSTPSAALLYNQARSLEMLGRYSESLSLLRKFEQEATPELKARVPKLAELLEEIARKTREEKQREEAEAASQRPERPEKPATANIEQPVVPAAPQQENAPTRKPAPMTSNAGSSDPLKIAAWSSLGLGVAAGALSLVSYSSARAEWKSICPSEAPSDTNCPGMRRQDAVSSYENWALLYHASLVTTVVGLGASGALFLWSSSESDGTTVSARVTPGGLHVSGRF